MTREQQIRECPEPFWHKTHRYCPVCTWTEDDAAVTEPSLATDGSDSGTPDVRQRGTAVPAQAGSVTADREQQIRERADAATQGPWEATEDGNLTALPPMAMHDVAEFVPDEQGMADATFMAHAREDIPWLLSELAAAEAEREKAVARAVRAEAVVEAARRVDVIYEGLRMDANDGSFALWSELDLCGALHDLGYAVSGLDALAGREGKAE